MKRTLRSAVLCAGIASAVAFGGQFALADSGAAAPTKGEAQHGDCHLGKGGHHRFVKRLERKLGLSDQQKAQVEALFKKRHEQMKPLMADLRKERGELHKLVLSGTADEAAIRAESAKVAAVQADLAVRRAQGAKEMMALLTPDQQAKLKALEEKWEQKMHKRFHHEGPAEE